jgi:phage gp36-like protein
VAYATESDLITKFGETEIDDLIDQESPNKLQDALDDAESEVNSYLAQRYTVPLSTVPNTIKSACCDIARYRLYSHNATEEVNQRYKDRIAWLKLLSKGELSIGVAEQSSKKSLKAITTTGGSSRIFTSETLRDF